MDADVDSVRWMDGWMDRWVGAIDRALDAWVQLFRQIPPAWADRVRPRAASGQGRFAHDGCGLGRCVGWFVIFARWLFPAFFAAAAGFVLVGRHRAQASVLWC